MGEAENASASSSSSQSSSPLPSLPLPFFPSTTDDVSCSTLSAPVLDNLASTPAMLPIPTISTPTTTHPTLSLSQHKSFIWDRIERTLKPEIFRFLQLKELCP